jgi:hypothetical protein
LSDGRVIFSNVRALSMSIGQILSNVAALSTNFPFRTRLFVFLAQIFRLETRLSAECERGILREAERECKAQKANSR